MKQSVKRLAKQWLLPVPNALRNNQIKPDSAGLAQRNALFPRKILRRLASLRDAWHMLPDKLAFQT